jgi:nitroreductase
MEYNDLLDLVKNTRSIRRFKPDPFPDDYIDKIIEVARNLAEKPLCGNTPV